MNKELMLLDRAIEAPDRFTERQEITLESEITETLLKMQELAVKYGQGFISVSVVNGSVDCWGYKSSFRVEKKNLDIFISDKGDFKC